MGREGAGAGIRGIETFTAGRTVICRGDSMETRRRERTVCAKRRGFQFRTCSGSLSHMSVVWGVPDAQKPPGAADQ